MDFTEYDQDVIRFAIEGLKKHVFETAKANGFHDDDGEFLYAFVRAALIHTEVSEVVEELRKDGVDWDKVAEECADIVIRVLDFAQTYDLPLGDAILSKMEKNRARPYKHGKAF